MLGRAKRIMIRGRPNFCTLAALRADWEVAVIYNTGASSAGIPVGLARFLNPLEFCRRFLQDIPAR